MNLGEANPQPPTGLWCEAPVISNSRILAGSWFAHCVPIILNVMLAIAYAAAAIGFYVWISRTAKEVPSPLGVWINTAEELDLANAA